MMLGMRADANSTRVTGMQQTSSESVVGVGGIKKGNKGLTTVQGWSDRPNRYMQKTHNYHTSSIQRQQTNKQSAINLRSQKAELSVHPSSTLHGSQILIVWSTLPEATTFTNFSVSGGLPSADAPFVLGEASAVCAPACRPHARHVTK